MQFSDGLFWLSLDLKAPAKRCGLFIRMCFTVKLLSQEGGRGFLQFVEIVKESFCRISEIFRHFSEKLPPKQRLCLN